MRMLNKMSVKFIMVSLLGFILFWIILTDAWGTSKLIFSNNVEIGEYIYGYLTRIMWVLPSIILILRSKENNLSIPWKTLISKPSMNKFFIITLSVLAIYSLTGMFIMHGEFHLNLENLLFLVIKVVIVGIVEEMVFRGWGYNALCCSTTHNKAMILSSLMFASIHCPAYIIKFMIYGNFDFLVMIQQFTIAFFFGILCCTLLRKGKSLWNPIIAHCFYDLLIFLML